MADSVTFLRLHVTGIGERGVQCPRSRWTGHFGCRAMVTSIGGLRPRLVR